MKCAWRLSSYAAQPSRFNGMRICSNIKSILPSTTTTAAAAFPRRQLNTLQEQNMLRDLVALFTPKPNPATLLKDELVREASDSVRFHRILDDNSNSLVHSDQLFLELLNQLDSYPSLALQVFQWRRNREVSESIAGSSNPIGTHGYSKGIKAAGRSNNIDFAVKLFNEAAKRGFKETETYNALMGAYMFNGHADKCYNLFLDMKKDPTCNPTIATYNILISVFGSLMLVDQMEAAFKEINELYLSPNVATYNYLIAGYISAWMWDRMEKVFQMLKSSSVEPNFQTYNLLIRGYAHSGNIVKMEEMYSLVRDHVNQNEMQIIRCMIVAYCKSSVPDNVKKVEALSKLISENHYQPCLNVWLIRLYAQLSCLEEMENAINEAFEHKTPVIGTTTMKIISAAYYRCDALENLEIFVRRAALADWKICRSLYHCKLVMYGSRKKLNEMQNVLEEMTSVNIVCTVKTLWVLYYAYWNCGQRYMVLKTLGQMFKLGYEVPCHAFPS